MNTKLRFALAGSVVAVALTAFAGTPLDEQQPPTENLGWSWRYER